MPIAVVDASVAVSWMMPDERSEMADSILSLHERGELDLIAPTLWHYEVANALSRAVVRGRITQAEGHRSLQMLIGMDLQSADFDALAARAWEISVSRPVSLYDAAYVALAETRGCELYTCDTELARVAKDLVAVRLVAAE